MADEVPDDPPCANCGRPLVEHLSVLHAGVLICPRSVYQPEP